MTADCRLRLNRTRAAIADGLGKVVRQGGGRSPLDDFQSKKLVVAYDGPGVDRCGDIFKQMNHESTTGAVAR